MTESAFSKDDDIAASKSSELPTSGTTPQLASADVKTIMETIRERVKREVKNFKGKPFSPKELKFGQNGKTSAGELLHSEELRELNQKVHYSGRFAGTPILTHRQGFLGKAIVFVKKVLRKLTRDLILKDYLQEQHEFNSKLVQFLNFTSKYVDARDGENFWELIRKIDVDTTKAVQRLERMDETRAAEEMNLERRLGDSFNATLTEISKRLSKSESELQQLQALNGVVSGLEAIVANVNKSGLSNGDLESMPSSPQSTDYNYLLFENRFRGSEGAIKQRLDHYLPYLRNLPGPVFEVGPGRGELLSSLKQENIAAFGVDSDSAMVERASALGLKVSLGDAIEELKKLEDHSLGAVVAIQVVEHLPKTVLDQFLQLCSQKIKSNGRVILETINPRSVLALSSNYFRDPSHVFPQHPDTLAFRMTIAGLSVEETVFLSPVGKESSLKEIELSDLLSPSQERLIIQLNNNIKMLNDLLFGFQDFCIIARVRGA